MVALEDHVVVIGAHEVGGELVKYFKREKILQMVLDFNPRQVEALQEERIPVIYGDMSDPEVLEELSLNKAKMIISTCPDVHDNKVLLEDLKTRKINAPTIVRAHNIKNAISLYKAGADFVIIPDILAGDALLSLMKDHFGDNGFFQERARIELDRLSKKTLAVE